MARVVADYDLCESNALCEAVAPDVFRLDDDDFLQIDDGTVTDENRARIEQAVASCPKAALKIVDE
ncbi:ferredoxin [Aeromicrobium terrae]|jgi:ferredoxin|uniref:Ferredoxin n=1 Tax=Aeromicrobium terrae TaxID=2498846 RepID=A0A5C8NID7_9ACTN|nr:ferredoxin [Aeromicrobium terrae]TXL60757.1 ferredoxin [Aeromicrobium terrae]